MTCAYNMARSFLDAKEYLDEVISNKIEDWEWKNIHVNEYAN